MHIGSVQKEKKEKSIFLKGDGMVTEWWLKYNCQPVDWKVYERSMNGALQF